MVAHSSEISRTGICAERLVSRVNIVPDHQKGHFGDFHFAGYSCGGPEHIYHVPFSVESYGPLALLFKRVGKAGQ